MSRGRIMTSSLPRISAARPDPARVVTLAVHTGQRGSDLVRMRWTDIEARDDGDGIRRGINVTQRKTGKSYGYHLRRNSRALFRHGKRGRARLWLSRTAGLSYVQQLSCHWWAELRNNAKLKSLEEAAGCCMDCGQLRSCAPASAALTIYRSPTFLA